MDEILKLFGWSKKQFRLKNWLALIVAVVVLVTSSQGAPQSETSPGKSGATPSAQSGSPETGEAATQSSDLKVGEAKQVTEPIPGRNQFSPSLSPDGKYVVFKAAANTNDCVVGVYSFEDKRFQKVLQDKPRGASHISRVGFNPDATKVLVTFSALGIWTLAETGKFEEVLAEPDAVDAVWSPDGNRIVYWTSNPSDRSKGCSVALYDLDTRATRVIASATAQYNFREPSFSADGKRVAYARWGRTKEDQSRALVISDIEGQAQPRVIPLAHEYVGWPAFSPDGKYLAYRAGKFSFTDVYVYDLSADKEFRITSGYALDPVWWPDSRSIVFGGPLGPLSERARFVLYRVDVGESDRTRVDVRPPDGGNKPSSRKP